MHPILIALKIFALFIALWFVPMNMVKVIRNQTIPPMNFAIMACSLTIFISLQFNLFQ